MNLIGKKISDTRKTKGLTQQELAEQSQVNLRTIQRIENNESEPRGKTLNLICTVLQLDITELTQEGNSINESKLQTKIVNAVFLLLLNLVLISIIGFLTLDSEANLNSKFGGLLTSILIPLVIVAMTSKMNGLERMFKFGIGYIVYFILVMLLHGFSIGFVSGLFPCLLISLSILYFGGEIMKHSEERRKTAAL